MAGYVTIAIYWHFSKEYDKMLSFTPIMIFGALLGILLSWVFTVEIVSSSITPATKLVKYFLFLLSYKVTNLEKRRKNYYRRSLI